MLLCSWNFPLSSLGDLLNLGIQPEFHTVQAASLPSESPGKPWGESKACFFEASLGHVACWQLETALRHYWHFALAVLPVSAKESRELKCFWAAGLLFLCLYCYPEDST